MDNKYTELLDSFFLGKTSFEEEEKLFEWLKDRSSSQEELEIYYKKKWAGSLSDIDDEIKDKIYHKIEQRITDKEKERKESHNYKITNILKWSVAACFIVITTLCWYSFSNINQNSKDLFEVVTDKGQKTNIKLPDGTLVWLNSASKLCYNGQYNKRTREVTLIGEGYFEVAKNKDKKFIVHTKNYDVEALGTCFNIKAYNSDISTTTTLFEGKVLIEGINYNTTLAPSESVSYKSSTGRFSKTKSERAYFAKMWKEDELVIDDNTTLEQLATILERNYNINIEFRNDSIKGLRYEGIIKNSNLINVLEIICLSGDVKYSFVDDKVILDSNKNVNK